MKWLADEIFPYPGFRYLVEQGLDILHGTAVFPSADDAEVIRIAREKGRILRTFDRDIGKLIFCDGLRPPPGVVCFRILDYSPMNAGRLLIDLLDDGFDPSGFFTAVRDIGIRKRPL